VSITERSLGLMIDGAGLSVEQAAEFNPVLENHVVGCGLFFAIADYRDPVLTDRAASRRAFALLPSDEFPHASAAAPHLFPDPDAMFERTTELLIEAIERAGTTRPRRSRKK
jgi:hypothetical protein